VEVNFGDDLAKPFSYDIKKCAGMALKWKWNTGYLCQYLLGNKQLYFLFRFSYA
jgi:hypothetical protein